MAAKSSNEMEVSSWEIHRTKWRTFHCPSKTQTATGSVATSIALRSDPATSKPNHQLATWAPQESQSPADAHEWCSWCLSCRTWRSCPHECWDPWSSSWCSPQSSLWWHRTWLLGPCQLVDIAQQMSSLWFACALVMTQHCPHLMGDRHCPHLTVHWLHMAGHWPAQEEHHEAVAQKEHHALFESWRCTQMTITFSIESSNVWVQNTSTIQVPNVPYENSAVTSRKQGPWPINDGTVFSHVPDHDINTHRARNPGSWMECSNKTMFSSFQTFRIHQNSVILCWEWTIWIHAVHTFIYIYITTCRDYVIYNSLSTTMYHHRRQNPAYLACLCTIHM